MKTATLTLIEVTNRFNGYGMPVVKVKSDINITVVNRGYNVFESIEKIDHSDIDQIMNTIMMPVMFIEVFMYHFTW